MLERWECLDSPANGGRTCPHSNESLLEDSRRCSRLLREMQSSAEILRSGGDSPSKSESPPHRSLARDNWDRSTRLVPPSGRGQRVAAAKCDHRTSARASLWKWQRQCAWNLKIAGIYHFTW